MGILDFFDGTPRDCQHEALLELERTWASADVLVLRAPVGSGKSRIAHCLGRWATGGTTVCVPTNQLVRQYTDTWPTLPTLPRGSSRDSAAARAVAGAPLKVANYWTYLAHRLYAPTVVFDEAHRLVPTLQDVEAITLWAGLADVPAWVRTAGELLAWAEAEGRDSLVRKLTQHPDTYTLDSGIGEYRRKPRGYVRLVPLTPRHNRPLWWPPRRVRKLVFMSATFDYEDLYDLGLEGRRVRIIDVDSPIVAADRPVVYAPVANMSHGRDPEALPRLAAAVRTLVARHAGQRGVVHLTYALSAQLRPLLSDLPELVWHTQDTREAQYAAWRRAPGAPTLMACGMAEGIDLPGDLCRWQAIAKVAWPDLADPAVAAKQRVRPAWYSWVAARELQQAVGRSSRGPGDWSVVYILDSSFCTLYNQAQAQFTPSFQEALHVVDPASV